MRNLASASSWVCCDLGCDEQAVCVAEEPCAEEPNSGKQDICRRDVRRVQRLACVALSALIAPGAAALETIVSCVPMAPPPPRRVQRLACVALSALIAGRPVTGKHLEGSVSSNAGFGFLGTFVFDCLGKTCDHPNEASTMAVNLKLRLEQCNTRGPAYHHMAVYCYDDEGYQEKEAFVSWSAVYSGGKPTSTNADKLFRERATECKGPACGHVPTGQRFPSCCKAGPDECTACDNFILWDAQCSYSMTDPIKQNARPRSWYCVLGSNDGPTMLPYKQPVEYTLDFVNQGGDDAEQFSKDEQGLNRMYLVFLFLNLTLVGVQLYSRTLYTHYHQLPRLLTVSVMLQLVATLFFVIHYWSYTYNGIGTPKIKLMAELAELLAKVMMLLMLMCVPPAY